MRLGRNCLSPLLPVPAPGKGCQPAGIQGGTCVFLLPISFGSLGIREGAYVLFYGAFAVPMETALLVSFFNLLGMLLNNLVGGIILALNPNRAPRTQSSR